MVIYPDIEIQRGRCVNLRRGHMQDPIIYDITPLESGAAPCCKWSSGVARGGLRQSHG